MIKSDMPKQVQVGNRKYREGAAHLDTRCLGDPPDLDLCPGGVAALRGYMNAHRSICGCNTENCIHSRAVHQPRRELWVLRLNAIHILQHNVCASCPLA